MQAISAPSNEEAQKAAWDAVCPLVGKLKTFHDYAFEMEAVLPLLLEGLTAGNPVDTLEEKMAMEAHEKIDELRQQAKEDHEELPRGPKA